MSDQNHKATDLACGRSAVLLWWLPVAALIVGANWPKFQLLLWLPAFLVMGAACLANAARCGRVHCYVTGPLFLLAAYTLPCGDSTSCQSSRISSGGSLEGYFCLPASWKSPRQVSKARLYGSVRAFRESAF